MSVSDDCCKLKRSYLIVGIRGHLALMPAGACCVRGKVSHKASMGHSLLESVIE